MPYLDKIGLGTLWNKIKETFQVKLVSGTNIKTINNTSLLGSGNISITASSVTGVKGNSESSYRTGNVNITPANIGAVPTTRTVNSKALSSNITLSASDVSAVPTTRTVNSKALSANITLSASDVGAPETGDTAWTTPSTNFNYIKRSGIVFVDFYTTSQSLSTTWTTIGTLPAGYRPSHNIYGPAMSLGTPQIAYFINRSSGVIQMRTNSGSGSYVTAFNISFPVL